MSVSVEVGSSPPSSPSSSSSASGSNFFDVESTLSVASNSSLGGENEESRVEQDWNQLQEKVTDLTKNLQAVDEKVTDLTEKLRVVNKLVAAGYISTVALLVFTCAFFSFAHLSGAQCFSLVGRVSETFCSRFRSA